MGWRAYEHSNQFIKIFKEFEIAAKCGLLAIRNGQEEVRSQPVAWSIDQITERIKRYLDDLEKITLARPTSLNEEAAEPLNSGKRADVLKELSKIAQEDLPLSEGADSISAHTLDALLDSSKRSYSVITFDDDGKKLDALLEDVAVLNHESPLVINALKRISAVSQRKTKRNVGKRRVLGKIIFSMKLNTEIEQLRRKSPTGPISLSELFRRLDTPDRRLLAAAAANTWIRLRLAWQVFDGRRDNLSSSTVFAFEQRNISYHLIRDVLHIAWNEDWGNPRHLLPNGRNTVNDDHATLREIFEYMFDCIDSVVRKLPTDVAAGLRDPMRKFDLDEAGCDIVADRRSELILHVLRQQATLVTLKAYRVWFHAFIEVSPQFCTNRQSRKDRKIVISRIFGELINWGREVEACLATGDDRPREGRLGPAGRPSSDRRQLSRKASTKLTLVDIPFFGRGVVPDPDVLWEIISTACHREHAVLDAWERLQQLVPTGFLSLISQLVLV